MEKYIEKEKNGKKEITYKITKNENNKVVKKKKVSEKTLVKKVDKIVYTNKLGKK